MQGDAAAAVHTAPHWIKMDTTACHVTAAAAGVTDDGHCATLSRGLRDTASADPQLAAVL